MPTFEIRDGEEIQDFVNGCAFFGTGGGGRADYGLQMLNKAFDEGKRLIVTDPSEVPDDAWTTCAYGMGSIAPRTVQVQKTMKQLGLGKVKVEYKLHEAINELEKYSSVKISGIVPLEIGAANTPDPVATAAHSGLVVVDGDYSGGRAVPEIIQTTPHMAGKSMIPLASADEWGNVAILKQAANNLVAEKIGKLISVLAYGNLAGNATYLIRSSEMKRIIVPGTLSRAFAAGKKISEFKRNKGRDVQGFAESLNGYFLFKGKVVSKEEEDRDGYYWGASTLRGVDEFKGKSFRIWFKNENHFSWFGKKAYVMSPDIITTLNMRTIEPALNPKIKIGDLLAVFGFNADPRFRTKEGLYVLGPAHFGFKEKYVPIERLVSL